MATTSTEGPDRVIRTLARLARVLERACVDLTLPQYRVLALVATGSERATHLAGELALTKPTVSAMVESLVERGLVERASVSGDRRAVRLTVTPAGRGALRAAEDAMRTRLETVITHVPDRALVEAALAQLADALDAARAERAKATEPV